MREAVDDGLAHSEFLYRLCSDAVERRESKQLDLRRRRAKFDNVKSLEDFDWSFNAQVRKSKIIDLATCGFIEKHENSLFIGPTGVGKSHIAQAIGGRACHAGHSVHYTQLSDALMRSSRS